MGTQCSNLLTQISNQTPRRNKLLQFITNSVNSSNNHNNTPAQQQNNYSFNLSSKLEFIKQIENQFIREGGKNVVDFEKCSQERYVVKFNDGSCYRGCVDKDGKRDKEGQQTWKDGTKYIGGWKANLPHGSGVLISPQGYTFEGQWHQGVVEGFGKYFGKTGSYQGQWSHNQPHGHGLQTWQDGSRYQGTYSHNHKHGHGKYTWPDHSTYIGQWSYGKITGHGTYHYVDGRVYTGSFKDNKMHGKGTYTWSDGRKYVGEYEEDKKEGKGRYVWPDGRYFEGEWRAGKRNGYGKMVYKNGLVKYGVWEDDKRVGETVEKREIGVRESQGKQDQQNNEPNEYNYHNDDQQGLSQSPTFSMNKNESTLPRSQPRPLYACSMSPYKHLKSYYQQYRADRSNMNQRVANRYKFIQSPFRKFNEMQLTGSGSYLSMMLQKRNLSDKERANQMLGRSSLHNKNNQIANNSHKRRESAFL